MIFAIFDNLIILLATALSLFSTRKLEVLLIFTGLLMVLVTYESVCDNEKSTARTAVKLALAAGFAFVSGGFAGFFIFALIHEFKFFISGFLAAVYFAVLSFISMDSGTHSGRDTAIVILECLAILSAVILLCLIRELMKKLQRMAEEERIRVQNSNINEMHEKRLNRELIKQNYLADKNARLVERENISRNIHNSVGHSITAAIMTLDAADMLYDVKPDEARKRMNDANERIRGSLESIRRAVRTLDAETKMLPVADLKAAMESIINEFVMDTERHVEIIYDLPEIVGNTTEPPAIATSNSSSGATAVTGSAGETASVNTSAGREDTTDGLTTATLQIPHEHAEFLTGVLQEMLTNGVKHGNATEFVVILSGDSAHIRLESKDNGRSDFTAENSGARIEKGFGVKKIISYAERCGGKTSFTNEDGFRAMVELPIIDLERNGLKNV